MTPVAPTEIPTGSRRIVFAEDQPEYSPLPAAVCPDGLVMTEWELSDDEMARLFLGGRVRVWVRMFEQRCEACGAIHPRRLQPLQVHVTAPDETCPMTES